MNGSPSDLHDIGLRCHILPALFVRIPYEREANDDSDERNDPDAVQYEPAEENISPFWIGTGSAVDDADVHRHFSKSGALCRHHCDFIKNRVREEEQVEE